MFHFQSLFNLRIPGKPEVYFANCEYETDDVEIANRLRKNSRFGQDLWEVDKEVLEEQAREAIVQSLPKKRGRPRKVQVITGKVTSDSKENQE